MRLAEAKGKRMKHRIFMFGSTGFIGKYLAQHLSVKDFEIKGFSSKDCDLLNPKSVERVFSEIQRGDVIIFVSSITRLRENSFESLVKNLQMAENLGKQLSLNAPQQCIFLSTVDVYGLLKDDSIIRETLPVNPQDYYSLSKLASEFILMEHCSEGNVSLAILRLSGVYGPGDEGKSTISALITSIIKEGRVCIYSDGKDLRDFVHVDDLRKVIQELIQNPQGLLVNVATGESRSILEIVQYIKSVFPRDFEVQFRAERPTKRIRNMVYDTGHLRRALPAVKFRALELGIKSYVETLIKP
jgi:nucleoside-diphosphate-sugar epimerase